MAEESLLSGPLEPTNEGYSIAKIAGLKLCEYLNKQHDLNYFCLMPPNLYGYNDNLDLEKSHVLSALIQKIPILQAGEEVVEVWGSGSKSEREFLFVDDLSDAILFFMKNYDVKKHGTFMNVGANQAISIRELALKIKNITGFKGEIYFNSQKPDGMPKKLMDSKKANQAGWKAKIGLADGLNLTYGWYKKTLNLD